MKFLLLIVGVVSNYPYQGNDLLKTQQFASADECIKAAVDLDLNGYTRADILCIDLQSGAIDYFRNDR